MKKIILLFGLIAFLLCGQEYHAQDREVVIGMRKNFQIYTYTGEDEDSLTTNQDTLDIVFVTEIKASIRKISISSKFDLKTTTDTIVKISILGENWDTEGFTTLLASTNSSAITADNQYEFDATVFTQTIASYLSVVPEQSTITLLDTTATWPNPVSSSTIDSVLYIGADTTETYNITNAAQTLTPFDFDFKRVTVRYIYPSEGHETGSGVDLDELIIRFWTH